MIPEDPGDASSAVAAVDEVTAAVILAGGRGTRFGGVDKGLVLLAGRPLIAHVAGRIRGQVARLFINVNRPDAAYRRFGAILCPDAPRARPATGPLVGLVSAFAMIDAETGEPPYILSVPVDTPFLPSDLAMRLASAAKKTGAPAAFATSGGRDHPTIAAWDRRARRAVRRMLDEQPEISLRAIMVHLGAVPVAYADDPIDPFYNINTPADLDAATLAIHQGNENADPRQPPDAV
ncbi:MAG: molybdenum cofactor guanylyltransferase [Rhodospirillales bacterium]|nr:molybdenum cofactor guanylyltransferase [Rhodospirillales bacterium]